MSADDPIASLLRATGRRPAVASERAARVREAARAAWQAEVVRRRRSRRLAWGLALAASVLLVVWTVRMVRGPAPPAPTPTLVVERVVHAAWAEHGSPVVLHAGREVGAGSTVRTSADGRAALRAPTGHGLRLDHDTSLRVLSDRGFLLERGAVYVDSGPPRVPAPPPIRIATARAAIDEVGTQFEARLAEGALTVRVREGQVQVGAGSASLRAFAGQSVTVDRSGRLTRAGALPDGGWEWTEHVAPPFPIEGRSLADFLTWAARERGARVRYLDRSLAERAPGIVLHGSVEGMTLDQAVASVTTTSGLVHRWEGKELVVREAP